MDPADRATLSFIWSHVSLHLLNVILSPFSSGLIHLPVDVSLFSLSVCCLVAYRAWNDSAGPQVCRVLGTYLLTQSCTTCLFTSIGSYLRIHTDGYWNNICYRACLNKASVSCFTHLYCLDLRIKVCGSGHQIQFVIHVVFSCSQEPRQAWNTITYFTDRQSLPKSKALIYHCENFSFCRKNGFFILSDNNFDRWQRGLAPLNITCNRGMFPVHEKLHLFIVKWRKHDTDETIGWHWRNS